jgi:hypothetical protein
MIMDIRGYEAIYNAVDGQKGEIIVEPWPLNLGPSEEDPSDFDPNFHLADGDDVRFLEISFNNETRAAHVLNTLGKAGLMAGQDDRASTGTPQLKLLGIVRDESEKVTHLTLEDLSAR